MLYNTKWDIYSLAGLISWLEKQPAGSGYNWEDSSSCLMCRYLQSTTGIANPARDLPNGFGGETIKDWGLGGYWDICETKPWTFGAALERARAKVK